LRAFADKSPKRGLRYNPAFLERRKALAHKAMRESGWRWTTRPE